ncbi:MAG: 2-amino-4-hydroxy-6-hydroxymethyldihydropteridine diphosphokinase [Dysgonamonadaceae bacterium]|jgi:2-amino-4-hydroxy-6-hydroxymethyldihydropteridine diphosphokinase|nr:2-amino-4-hydroxy-6-hydroxymethyldihydropteridine diphosphokinase [Dysgonamonadaceae bacterium]
MHTVYLALGTNLGDKDRNLQVSIEKIAKSIGTLAAASSVYISESWGYISENTFLNQVIKVETELSPIELLHTTQAIEKQMGRTRKSTSGYQDRVIDIDIILYDNLVYQSEELTIPHPFYRQRPFVLEPLKEILSRDENFALR